MELYEEIKNKIIEGVIREGEKIPSKRALAEQKHVSVKTVENAYEQLIVEGYITARNKSGYYANKLEGYYRKAQIDNLKKKKKAVNQSKYLQTFYKVNLRANQNRTEDFPANTWCRLMRETLLNDRDQLFTTIPFNGIYELRKEIASYLERNKAMSVRPDQIIVGAGTEYLYGRLIQLLREVNPSITFAVEDPGSPRIREIYQSNFAKFEAIELDGQGINIEALEQSEANIVHITPGNHYPLGIVTPVFRRVELLKWVNREKGRYILEDDYDSEYSIYMRPVPSIYSIDVRQKVIYLNTFSKSVSPSVRISYMVLPESLMEPFFRTMSFYSCTVPSFEQYTLAKFIKNGYLERYIRRINHKNRQTRELLLDSLKVLIRQNKLSVWSNTVGNHVLLKIYTDKSDQDIKTYLKIRSVLVPFLQEYCEIPKREYEGVMVVNYSGITSEQIAYFVQVLQEIL